MSEIISIIKDILTIFREIEKEISSMSQNRNVQDLFSNYSEQQRNGIRVFVQGLNKLKEDLMDSGKLFSSDLIGELFRLIKDFENNVIIPSVGQEDNNFLPDKTIQAFLDFIENLESLRPLLENVFRTKDSSPVEFGLAIVVLLNRWNELRPFFREFERTIIRPIAKDPTVRSTIPEKTIDKISRASNNFKKNREKITDSKSIINEILTFASSVAYVGILRRDEDEDED